MTKKHLPVFGVGPYMIALIAAITLSAMALTSLKLIPAYNITQLNTIFVIIGILLVIIGIVFWLLAVIKSGIDKSIRNNDLITNGIYGYVRHPIYATFLYITTGIIVIYGNILLFILPIIFWAFLSLMMKKQKRNG